MQVNRTCVLNVLKFFMYYEYYIAVYSDTIGPGITLILLIDDDDDDGCVNDNGCGYLRLVTSFPDCTLKKAHAETRLCKINVLYA